VAFSRSRHGGVPNLAFDLGDAENLKLANETVDAVINVESSHCYGNAARFLAEVSRILRRGGHFLFADLREPAEMQNLRNLLGKTRGFSILEEDNITPGVVAAMSQDTVRKREMIRALVPSAIRPLFNEFAGLAGGQVFDGLRNGRLVYYRFQIRKTE
jgi:SAM-dependent methyltransferase